MNTKKNHSRNIIISNIFCLSVTHYFGENIVAKIYVEGDIVCQIKKKPPNSNFWWNILQFGGFSNLPDDILFHNVFYKKLDYTKITVLNTIEITI